MSSSLETRLIEHQRRIRQRVLRRRLTQALWAAFAIGMVAFAAAALIGLWGRLT